jgi:chitin synthase
MSTYINVLMVYAFNNWHDVSWGTKGSDVAESLPSAVMVKGEVAVVEEIAPEQEDIDERFEKVVKRALAPSKSNDGEKKRPKETEDSYKSFRTGLVYSWLISNIGLIIIVTTDSFSIVGVGVSLLNDHVV